MVDKLTKEQIEEYREAFDYYDTDRDGKISAKEVATVIRACGQAPSQKQVEGMVKEIGESAKLDFNQFITLAMKNPIPCGTAEEVLESFKVIDKDGSGFLPSSELKHTMANLGEKLTDIEAEYMLQEAGVDAENKVNYEQFVRDMMQYK